MRPLILAAAGPSPLWYLTRASGLVALVLLTVVMVFGVASLGRWSTPVWPRFATAGVHRGVSLMAVVFLALHILTAELDTFAPIGWLAVVVPFASSYRPLWLGLGTAAFDLLVALVVTSLLREHIGYKTWRALHWAAYACWPLAVVHGLGTGSDPRLGWVEGLVVACVAAVLMAGGWRLSHGWPWAWRARVASALGAVALVLVVGVWAVGGPLKPGWAKRAGTPASLLGSNRHGAGAPAPQLRGTRRPPAGPSGSGSLPAPPYTAALAGTIVKAGPPHGAGTTTIDARLSGAASGTLTLILHGAAPNSGIALRSSNVSFGPPNDGSEYRGQVTRLDGTAMQATVTSAGRPTLTLGIALDVNSGQGPVNGAVTVTAAGGPD